MPVELTIVESVTELETTVVEVVLESASAPGPAGPGVAAGGTVGQVLTKQSGTDFDTDWEDPTGGGGGAPTTVDYLVGTASGDLSAEIVVGTSPGGELGGTWASPTVDATHSGSSHASVQAAAEATAAAALAAHTGDTSDAHDASAISVDSTSLSGTGTDVQASLEELDNLLDDHSARHENGGADEISIAGLDGTPTELTNHLNDTSAAHAASAISADSTTLVGTGTDVQAVLEELDNGIADHIADATAAHAASAISFTPDGSIAATTVQAAIVEVRDEASGGSAANDMNLVLHMEVFA